MYTLIAKSKGCVWRHVIVRKTLSLLRIMISLRENFNMTFVKTVIRAKGGIYLSFLIMIMDSL